MITLLLASVAGGLGAGARFVVDGAVNARRTTVMPWGSSVVNVLGSFLLGVVAGAWVGESGTSWRLVLGTGFLGGFTTFSTATLESVRLVHEGRRVTGLSLSAGMLVVCLLAAWSGLVVGAG